MSYMDGDRMRIDVPNALLEKLKLGDVATVTITGKVTELVAGRDPVTDAEVLKETGADCCCGPSMPWKPPAGLTLEVTGRKVAVSGNEFSTLSEDEE